MKVIGINGSPRAEGNTAMALREMAGVLTAEGIDMEIVHIGGTVIRGCMACGGCGRNKNGKCVITTDLVNETIARMSAADAIVLGSPVHYAGIGGTMKSFCDRAFYVAAANGGMFAGKPGASVVAVRRSGGSMAWSALNFYLTISQMPIAGSTYWNIVHGALAGEASDDAEGLQTVRNTARSLASMLRGTIPTYERGARTNFIR